MRRKYKSKTRYYAGSLRSKYARQEERRKARQERKKYYNNPENKSYYTSPAWRELRRQVLERDGGICQYCGRNGHQADHIVARSRGGKDALENLVCACHACNKAAGAKLFLSFEEKKRWILSHRKIVMRPIMIPNSRDNEVPVMISSAPPQSRLRDRLKAKRQQEREANLAPV